jgi:hypothetical protein
MMFLGIPISFGFPATRNRRRPSSWRTACSYTGDLARLQLPFYRAGYNVVQHYPRPRAERRHGVPRPTSSALADASRRLRSLTSRTRCGSSGGRCDVTTPPPTTRTSALCRCILFSTAIHRGVHWIGGTASVPGHRARPNRQRGTTDNLGQRHEGHTLGMSWRADDAEFRSWR